MLISWLGDIDGESLDYAAAWCWCPCRWPLRVRASAVGSQLYRPRRQSREVHRFDANPHSIIQNFDLTGEFCLWRLLHVGTRPWYALGHRNVAVLDTMIYGAKNPRTWVFAKCRLSKEFEATFSYNKDGPHYFLGSRTSPLGPPFTIRFHFICRCFP